MAAYAGDVTPQEAWRLLQANPKARLVDVRTMAEWRYVGLPDLTALGQVPVLAEWQGSDGVPNPAFADQVEAAGVEPDAPVLLLCRSGARSRSAAIALTQRGYGEAYNISNGFEGPPDAEGHRGQVDGWKATGLPWRQD